MRKIVLLFLSMVSICIFAQQTIMLDGSKVVDKILDTTPSRAVDISDEGITVTYHFNSFLKRPDPIYKDAYFVDIKGFGYHDVAGEPSTLVHWDSFVVPTYKDTNVELIDSSYIEFNFELSPARKPLLTTEKVPMTREEISEINAYTGLFPFSVLSISDVQHYRGTPLLKVCIHPVQYNYELKRVRVYTTLIYRIRYTESSDTLSSDNNNAGYVSPDDPLLNNITLNGYDVDTKEYRSKVYSSIPINKSYLIISVNDFQEAVTKLAEWKRTLGYNVHVSMRSSWDSATVVKNEILNVYNEDPNLYYLLIIGSHSKVPSQVINYHPTDFYYGCIDGDSIPDVMRGRLPARTNYYANVMVDKIINYERTPYVGNSSFYNNGVHCAYFEDDAPKDGYEDKMFVQTSEDIRDYLLTQQKTVKCIYNTDSTVTPTHWNTTWSTGGAIPTRLLRPGFTWSGNATNIKDSIDAGAFYVLYRDHGSAMKWNFLEFTCRDIDSLNNGSMLPVVFSICCNTGMFNLSFNCFCEDFIAKENGGCVAIIGASNASNSGQNNALAVGMFDAIWPNPGLLPNFNTLFGNNNVTPTPTPTFCMGQILDQGMARMFENYKFPTQETREIYNLFGDPSMQIHTNMPTEFNNVVVSWESDRIYVTTHGETATIAFYNKYTGMVRTFWGTYANFITDCPEDYSVCVSAHDKIPYIENADVLFIQNVTTTGSNSYNADYIKVGTNVTNEIPPGDVTLGGSQVTLTGKRVILNGSTTVPLGTQLTINP